MLQERYQLHGEVLNGIIEELQLELQTKDDLLAKLHLGERMEDKEAFFHECTNSNRGI